MTSIKLIVTGATARAEVDGLLTTGMVGVPVSIEYDSSWDGLVKNLVCKSCAGTRAVIDVGNSATVPHEVMSGMQSMYYRNKLYIGVEGRNADGTLVIPTIWADCGRIFSGANPDADPSTDPTPPVWEQIIAMIGDLAKLDTEAKENLVAAVNEALTKGSGTVDDDAVLKIVTDYLAANPPADGTDGRGIASISRTAGTGAAGTVDTYTITYTDKTMSTFEVRNGIDGKGSVVTVNQVSPDADGNVQLAPADIGALATDGTNPMTGPLDMGGYRVQNVAEPVEDGDAVPLGYAKKVGAPHNLLDNSDFRNPVNQRGQESYAGAVYGIDRWTGYGESCAVNVENGYIEVFQNPASTATTKLWVQHVLVNERNRGKTVTFAAKIKGGSVRLNFNNTTMGTYVASDEWHIHVKTAVIPEDADTFFVGLQSRNTTDFMCEWAMLLEGEYTAETLPEYQGKDHALEWLECMRYDIEDVGKYIHGVIISDGSIRVAINIPVPMRITPTAVAINLDNAVAYIDGTSAVIPLTGVTIKSMNGNSVILSFATDLTAGTYQFAGVTIFNTSIGLNADL